MKKFKVLSTKKIPPELVTESGKNHIELNSIEFIRIETLFSKENQEVIKEWVTSKSIPAVFTSANAVDSLQTYLPANSFSAQELSIYSLSGKTKEELIKYFPSHTMISTAVNASELAKKIIADKRKSIIFFCGNKRREELPSLLKDQGILVQEVILYKTIEIPVTIKEHFDGVLFFSPSAVSSFFSVNRLNKEVICFTVGETTANAVKKYTNNIIIQSPVPSSEILIQKMIGYYKQYNTTNE